MLKSFFYRIKFFLRTGSIKFPVLSSNISVVAEADAKLAKVEKALSDHENATIVRHIALAALKSRRDAIVAGYNKFHDATDKLLESL